MNNELSTEQQNQLKSWAEQRDSILLEISNLRTEKEKLSADNAKIAESTGAIEAKANQIKGRLVELDKQEKEYTDIMSVDIAKAIKDKAELQAEISELTRIVDLLQIKKDTVAKDISSLVLLHDKVFNRVSVLDKVIDHVVRTNESATNDTNALVVSLKKSIQELIDLNQRNVEDTKNVLGELPKLFFELQRKSLIRQTI